MVAASNQELSQCKDKLAKDAQVIKQFRLKIHELNGVIAGLKKQMEEEHYKVEINDTQNEKRRAELMEKLETREDMLKKLQ